VTAEFAPVLDFCITLTDKKRNGSDPIAQNPNFRYATLVLVRTNVIGIDSAGLRLSPLGNVKPGRTRKRSISEILRARAIQAALASAGCFAVGAAMPLLVTGMVLLGGLAARAAQR
jgi:hypothetical protein